MNGRKPNKAEQHWLDFITDYGCVVCANELLGDSPAEVHHFNGGSNHLDTIPLCYLHHREGSNNDQYTSLHPHKAAFSLRYGTANALWSELMEQYNDGDRHSG